MHKDICGDTERYLNFDSDEVKTPVQGQPPSQLHQTAAAKIKIFQKPNKIENCCFQNTIYILL